MVVEEDLVEKICRENKEFKKLWENHYELKEKIQEFERMKYLTPEEELERKKLKKIKLKEKDLIMQMVSEYRSKQV
ncbi:MAG: DUF465 domain-containing protein [Nitrospinae bacterium]|jgi:hypothetical protein|nr:DUF465 domain-containing protein [Nitrospinota bacterium]MDP7580336.1 DUF465 domain-containing protein [Nitrospinota bacterium]HJN01706.1 DUF465 domain-containing protein [Nitrospinota bacterium]|tara:strand:+ start:1206 stop:1433 length:228 start_codon:yes stop_codon:yes gene_type:complete